MKNSIAHHAPVVNVTALFQYMRDELRMPESHIAHEFNLHSTEVKRIRMSNKPVYLIDGVQYSPKERHKDATKTAFDPAKLHKYIA